MHPVSNQGTLQNIRLWDWRTPQDTLRQIQKIQRERISNKNPNVRENPRLGSEGCNCLGVPRAWAPSEVPLAKHSAQGGYAATIQI